MAVLYDRRMELIADFTERLVGRLTSLGFEVEPYYECRGCERVDHILAHPDYPGVSLLSQFPYEVISEDDEWLEGHVNRSIAYYFEEMRRIRNRDLQQAVLDGVMQIRRRR